MSIFSPRIVVLRKKIVELERKIAELETKIKLINIDLITNAMEKRYKK